MHPFVERLIGTVRREYLDRILFRTKADLETKLLDFNITIMAIELMLGWKDACQNLMLPDLDAYQWLWHCRGLYLTPIAT